MHSIEGGQDASCEIILICLFKLINFFFYIYKDLIIWKYIYILINFIYIWYFF